MRKFLVSAAAAILLGACQTAETGAPLSAAAPAFLTDPPHDAAHPARMEVLHIPSGGVEINGVAYLASGAGAHPTVVICHGWPGNEKNLDLAQAVRRAGWNAITFNYRGSWGSPGEFHFSQVPEDAAAVITFLRKPENATKYGIDPKRIAIVGHSMGGWATAQVGSKDPTLLGAGLISAGDMGRSGTRPRDAVLKQAAGNAETLATTVDKMADELIANADANALIKTAPGLAKIPVLILTADDGGAGPAEALAAAIKSDGGARVETKHFTTDHSYSDARLALETTIITWLNTLPGAK